MMNEKKIFIGSDHAGYELKTTLFSALKKEFSHLEFEDSGCPSTESVDYPEIAKTVSERVSRGEGRGILLCGSGIGQSIVANKFPGVRAALVWDVTSARLSREHNDSNILCCGARLLGYEVILDICRVWLVTHFLHGRHQKRIELIEKMEKLIHGKH